jgi:hypothetical protein
MFGGERFRNACRDPRANRGQDASRTRSISSTGTPQIFATSVAVMPYLTQVRMRAACEAEISPVTGDAAPEETTGSRRTGVAA